MLRKIGIVLTVIAVGMTMIQTEAFARRGGGHGGSRGGGHVSASQGISRGHFAAPGRVRAGRGALDSRPSGLRSRDGWGSPGGQGSWGGCNMPYDYRYQDCGGFL